MKNLVLLSALSGALVFTGCEKAAESPDDPSAASNAPAAAQPDAAGSMPLVTEIPPELIEGTPMPVQAPNLEQAPTRAPSMLVPEGTVLVSQGKEVTGSDDFPLIGELSYITDGDKEAGEGYFVELLNDPQWVQIDLGEPVDISAIWVWHFHSQKRAYNDVVVQVSNDPSFESEVTTLFNNDYDNSSELGKGKDKPYVESRFGKLIDGKGTNAQYVRLWSNGNTSNDMNHYIEVEVFGVPKA
ncbi:MAG: discoidin domain-containing protein [Verrucomicrobiota bacterium]